MHTRVLNLYKAALVKLHNPSGNDDSKDPPFLNHEQTTRGDIDMEDLITRLLPIAPVDEGVVRKTAPRWQHEILVLQQHVARNVLIFLNNVARQTGPLLEEIDETESQFAVCGSPSDIPESPPLLLIKCAQRTLHYLDELMKSATERLASVEKVIRELKEEYQQASAQNTDETLEELPRKR